MSLADLLDDGNDPSYEAMLEVAKELQLQALRDEISSVEGNDDA